MLKSSISTDCVVLGAGAAGLMCAIEAGKRGRRVVILERSEAIGKKIRISGGGRCNFTNVNADAGAFLSENPHFCKSALARYTPADFIRLVERHRIPYHEKTLGQLFCDNSSTEIIAMLEQESHAAGVEIVLNCKIDSVRKSDRFIIETNAATYTAQSLVVATGGISIPKIGATDFGYRLAGKFDLALITPRPGLVPLLWSERDRTLFGELSGVSFHGIAHCGNIAFDEAVLFTHRGLSGPAILQISSYWRTGKEIAIDMLPGTDASELIISNRQKSVTLASLLSEHLPKRFAQRWCEEYASPKPLSQLPDTELRAFAERLHRWDILPAGTEGLGKAEVTVGGISTGELSSKTMEARNVPGLYCIGEVVDVTGHLGGFNFQWAWASGFVAGQFA